MIGISPDFRSTIRGRGARSYTSKNASQILTKDWCRFSSTDRYDVFLLHSPYSVVLIWPSPATYVASSESFFHSSLLMSVERTTSRSSQSSIALSVRFT
jgi:hypothetical protein